VTGRKLRKSFLKPQTLRKNGKPRMRRRFKTLIGIAVALPVVFGGVMLAEYGAESQAVDNIIGKAAVLDAKTTRDNAAKVNSLDTGETKQLLSDPLFSSSAWTDYAAAVTASDDQAAAAAKRQMAALAYSSIAYPNIRERYLAYIRTYKPVLSSTQEVQIYALGVIGGTCADIDAKQVMSVSTKRFAPAFELDKSGTVLPSLVAYASALCRA
jgi:hypothetical protein